MRQHFIEYLYVTQKLFTVTKIERLLQRITVNDTIATLGNFFCNLDVVAFFEKNKDGLDVKQKNIKAFLMDQRNIAGIGNIYSDEILFQAKISPQRKIEDLTQKEKKVLFQKTRYVLTKATKFLISLREFPKSWLEPHRHTDRICPRNKNHKLSREIIGGRPAIFCHICQK